MERRWLVGLAVILVALTAGALLPVSGASGTGGVAPAQDSPQLGTPDGFNTTEFRLTVHENGTTRWTIAHRRFLGDNETEIEQFRSFAADFNTTETKTYRDFKTRSRALTSFGNESTGREMNATAFSKVAYVEQQFRGKVGVVEMSFTWTNFARTTDRGVAVDDVFDGGMYIGPDQRLVFEHGPNLTFENAQPQQYELQTDSNLSTSPFIEYRGEQDFADERPRVVLTNPNSGGQPSTTDGTTTPDGATESSDEDPTETTAKSSEFGAAPLVVAILLLLGVGGAIAWYSGSLGSVLRDRGDGDAGAATEAPAEAEPTAEPEAAGAAVPEEELLSDEDRVLKLLEENGGRMKQVNIVENTEWSKSKVSMLLSDMEEEGLISKLRVGRENIISKAGEEPDAVGSPFDDE